MLNANEELIQETNPWTSEEKLIAAVMARAAEDYRHLRELQARYGDYDSAPSGAVHEAWDAGVDAQVWFQSKSTEPMSFLAICTATGLDPRAVMAALDQHRPEDDDVAHVLLPEIERGMYGLATEYAGRWVTRREVIE